MKQLKFLWFELFLCNKKLTLTDENFGSPRGNRTPDTAVKGRCLNRLTIGPY